MTGAARPGPRVEQSSTTWRGLSPLPSRFALALLVSVVWPLAIGLRMSDVSRARRVRPIGPYRPARPSGPYRARPLASVFGLSPRRGFGVDLGRQWGARGSRAGRPRSRRRTRWRARAQLGRPVGLASGHLGLRIAVGHFTGRHRPSASSSSFWYRYDCDPSQLQSSAVTVGGSLR